MRLMSLIFCVMTIFGCSGWSDGFSRVDVAGKVTVGGKPIPFGYLSFVSREDDLATTRPQSSAQINNGYFEVSDSEGPIAGPQDIVVVLLEQTKAIPDPSVQEPQPEFTTREIGSARVQVKIPDDGIRDLAIDIEPKQVIKPGESG